MQKNSIPDYKPTKELQDLINSQQLKPGQRRRTAVLPKRNWIQRNPKTFQISFITISMLILFSKPIYDAFFVIPPPPPAGGPIPAYKR